MLARNGYFWPDNFELVHNVFLWLSRTKLWANNVWLHACWFKLFLAICALVCLQLQLGSINYKEAIISSSQMIICMSVIVITVLWKPSLWSVIYYWYLSFLASDGSLCQDNSEGILRPLIDHPFKSYEQKYWTQINFCHLCKNLLKELWYFVPKR